jgi:hypothetical protein
MLTVYNVQPEVRRSGHARHISPGGATLRQRLFGIRTKLDWPFMTLFFHSVDLCPGFRPRGQDWQYSLVWLA